MPLTIAEQEELELLKAQLEELKKSTGQTPTDGADEVKKEDRGLAAGLAGTAADIGLPALAATAGQAVGAVPVLSVPTFGLSVPALGGTFGTAAYVANELAQGRSPTMGGATSAFISSAFPGGQVAGAGAKALVKEGVKQTAAALTASQAEKAIEKGEIISPEEAIATGIGTAIGVKAASKVGKKGVEAERELARQYATRDDTLRFARALGYTLDTVQSNANSLTKGVERLAGGQAAVQREAARKNQLVTNSIIRSEIGLPPDAELNDMVLAIRKFDVSEPYRELEKLSPVAKSAMERLSTLRRDAADYWRDYSINGRVETRKTAEALQKKAEVIENSLDKLATKYGSPTLVDEMRAARKQLAKIHVIESALNPKAQNVDAIVIGKIQDKNPDYLTDGLKAIADIANIQAAVMKEFTRIPSGQSNQLARSIISGTLGTVGYGTGGVPGAVAGMIAGSVSDIPFRALATSQPFQAALAIPRYEKLTTPTAVQTFLMQSGRQAGL